MGKTRKRVKYEIQQIDGNGRTTGTLVFYTTLNASAKERALSRAKSLRRLYPDEHVIVEKHTIEIVYDSRGDGK